MMLMVVAMVVVVLPTFQQTADAYKAALLIIDVQDCFLPEGGLAVPEGEQVIPMINRLRQQHEDKFSLVVLTQDWHCADHVSFASQHPGFQPFSAVNLSYNKQGTLCYGDHVPESYPHAVDCSGEEDSHLLTLSQTLWPDHCIINVTSGPTSAQFSPLLMVKDSDIIVRKGDSCGLDSYSAFFDNGGFHQTELHSVLQAADIDLVVVTGLALDFCVYYTSKDAHVLGYKVLTVTDASRGVGPDTTVMALQDLSALGVELVEAQGLGSKLTKSYYKVQDFSSLSYVLTMMVGALLIAFCLMNKRQ